MTEQSGFNRIPVDIVINILLRLAVTDLLKLKWVSSYWYKFIGGYDFIKLHLKHVLDNSDQLSNKRLVFYVTDDDQSNQENRSKKHIALYSAYLDPIALPVNQHDGALLKFKRLSLTQRSKRLKCSIIVGSCNGIVCLRDDAGNAFTLLNPTTESRRDIEGNDITTIIYRLEHKKFLFGFSYDSESDDYKVVKVTQSYQSKWCYINLMVSSLRNKHWKKCRSVKWTYRLLTSSKRYGNDYGKREETCNGISCNNALHWLAEDMGDPTNSHVIIVIFDLRNNHFRCHEDMPLTSIDGVSHPSLSVINGSLHLMTINQGSQGIDVWVMKEYGVAESSWCKLGTTKQVVSSNLPRLISLSEKRNEMVLHWDQGPTTIISLTDITSNTLKGIQWARILPDDEDEHNHVSQPYIETLVTLQGHDDRDA